MNSLQNQHDSQTYESMMQYRISKILMICTSYDAFIMEEDGKIEQRIYEEYAELNLRNLPRFTWVNTSEAAKALLFGDDSFDMVICMFNEQDSGIFPLAREMKDKGMDIPFVLLMHYSKEIRRKVTSEKDSAVDFVFSWHGNADLIMAIIKLFEDKRNAPHDILQGGVQAILLAEDSIRYYSTYLPELYKLVLAQSNEFLKETLNQKQQKNLKRSRPKILLATCYEDAVQTYEMYKNNYLGIITDIGMVIHKGDSPKTEKLDAGIDLVNLIRSQDANMPILMQSSQGSMAAVAKNLRVGFVRKYSRSLFAQLSDFIKDEFAFGDLVFRDDRGVEYARAGSLQELEAALRKVPDEVLLMNTSRNIFSKWFFARGIFSLGRKFRAVHNTEAGAARSFVLSEVRAYRKSIGQGIIASYTPSYDGTLSFTRLGEGSLGGKARGLAFLNRLVEKYSMTTQYEGISVSIPRTVVVTTDYFDEFMERNGLNFVIDSELSDDEILSEFVASRLPEELVEALRVYLSTVRTPLAVRSSSKLEDSNYQPFAGVYSTYMIPLVENKEQMLRMLDKAIKSVFASVFYNSSRTYIQTTGNLQSEEKMAVIIQNVCGSEHDGKFYPLISGVGRSVNFYPIGNEKAEDGIVNVVFGLGKAVVDGEHTLRFSPKYPKKILQLSQPDLAIRDTQRKFFALDLNPRSFKISRNEGINLDYISVNDAVGVHPFAHYALSTFDSSCFRMVPGVEVAGPRVVSFDGLLKYAKFPFAKALREIMDICRSELQCDVEMEFAADVNPDGESLSMKLLQVRPISRHSTFTDTDTEHVRADLEKTYIYSSRALGTGFIQGVHKFVYISPDGFDSLKTVQMARELSALNASLRAQDCGGYILIGPGRWGSSDHSLGIPVIWSDISEAKMIVELGIPGFQMEPSQGTHFFQNLTALGVGYLTINMVLGDGELDDEAITSLPCSYNGEFVKVYEAPKDLTAFIDHRTNTSVIGLEKEEQDDLSQ